MNDYTFNGKFKDFHILNACANNAIKVNARRVSQTIQNLHRTWKREGERDTASRLHICINLAPGRVCVCVLCEFMHASSLAVSDNMELKWRRNKYRRRRTAKPSSWLTICCSAVSSTYMYVYRRMWRKRQRWLLSVRVV